MDKTAIIELPKASYDFIEELCCPECRCRVSWTEQAIRCTACNRMFSLDNGIPNLFVRVEPAIQDTGHPFRQFLVSPAHIKLLAQKTGADQIELVQLINPRQSAPIRYRIVLTALRLLLWTAAVSAFFLPHGLIIGSVAMLSFALDVVWLKATMRRQHRLELAQLLAEAKRGAFHEKDVKDPLSKADQPDIEEIAEDRPVVIGNALKGIPFKGKSVLHVGCGGEHDADLPQVYVDLGARLIGLDVYPPALAAFKKLFSAPAVLAEALCMPFHGNSFDFANCTDIIEHVHDPFKFLQENFRVLKPGGEMLLITPNRFRIRRSYSVINPLVFLLPVIGRIIPGLMFPREVIASRMLPRDVDPTGRVFIFFHTSFTTAELKPMLVAAGFEIIWLKVKAYRGPFRRIRSWLEGIPLLNEINDSVFAVVRKPTTGGHRV